MDDENDNNFTQVPLPPIKKKRQINIQHPAVILMILSVAKKVLKAQVWEKEGAKSLNLHLPRKRKQKKKKKKKKNRENDLVVSSEESDSKLSEAEDK